MANGMGGLHVREGDDRAVHYQASATPRRPAPTPTPRLSDRERERRRQQLEQEAQEAAEYARSPGRARVLDALARDLGVPRCTLDALRCGWWQLANGHEGYTWPMVDGDFRVCGVATRSVEGEKGMLSGYSWVQTLGLFVKLDIDLTSTEPLYLCEGPTDLCVLLALGLVGAGRPSNRGGAEYLTQLLRDYRGPIIIIADNDRKPNGTWPGLDGARRLARQLRQLLGREVWIALPPGGAKDTRQWLHRRCPELVEEDRLHLVDADTLHRLGCEYEEQLWANALTVEQADMMLAIAAGDGATEASALPLTDPAALVQLAMAQAADPPADTHDASVQMPRGRYFEQDPVAEKCPHCHGTHLERLNAPGVRQVLWLRCWRNTCSGCWRRKRREDKEQAAVCFTMSFAAGQAVRVLDLRAVEYRKLTGKLRKDPTRLRILTDAGRHLIYPRADLGPDVGTEFADAAAAIEHMAAAIDGLTADGAAPRKKRVTFSGKWRPDKRERKWRRLSNMPHDVPTAKAILSAHGILNPEERRVRRGAGRLSLYYEIPPSWTTDQVAALDVALEGAVNSLSAGGAKTVYIPLTPKETVFASPGDLDAPPDDWAFQAPAEPPD